MVLLKIYILEIFFFGINKVLKRKKFSYLILLVKRENIENIWLVDFYIVIKKVENVENEIFEREWLYYCFIVKYCMFNFFFSILYDSFF